MIIYIFPGYLFETFTPVLDVAFASTPAFDTAPDLRATGHSTLPANQKINIFSFF